MRMNKMIWLAAALMALAATQIGNAENGGPLADTGVPPAWGLDYIGTPEQTGTTWYDYQHNGSMSRMIAYAADGSVHVSWMNGLVTGGTQRVIYYNKRSAAGVWQYGNVGTQVNVVSLAGYCTMDLDLSDNAVIAYHAKPGTGPYIIYVWNSTGEHACPVAPGTEYQMTWPHVAVDAQGYIHVVAHATTSASLVTGNMYYTRSQNGGVTWTPWQLVAALGTSASISQTVTTDPASFKVAIAWTKPIAATVTQADVYYVESLDGVTWNFAAPINLTNFAGGGHPDAANSRAYCDVGGLYDAASNLHLSYTTVAYPTLTNGGKIWHWSQATGHDYVTGTYVANAWTALNNPGAWRRSIDRGTLSQDAAGTLYCQWGQCTTPGDVSSANYGNWDVWATYSDDNGENWNAPVNVTDTATPGGTSGNCLSENWANVAKVASNRLHIQYIKDLDAGGIPQTEGTWTLNPVIYQAVPIDSIQTYILADLAATLPIVIPPGGGQFPYTVTITNTGYRVLHFDGWLDITLPNGSTYPVLNRPALTLPPGASIVRPLTQSIPGSAPAGNYTFWLHAGDLNWNAWGEDSFPFSKSGVDGSTGGSWECTGWEEEETPSEGITGLPTTHLMSNCYPNPFNPTTIISYTLPQTSKVIVKVYNIAGSEVAQLVNGWRLAGSHQVAFDASSLSSGMYLYRIQAGEITVSGKMLLVK